VAIAAAAGMPAAACVRVGVTAAARMDVAAIAMSGIIATEPTATASRHYDVVIDPRGAAVIDATIATATDAAGRSELNGAQDEEEGENLACVFHGCVRGCIRPQFKMPYRHLFGNRVFTRLKYSL
jgi:hypothetical protein